MKTHLTGFAVAGYFRRRRSNSFALIMVMWMLALLTIMVSTLLFVVATDRTTSSNYAEQIKAQEIAMAGMQTFIGDLRREMRAGSSVLTFSGSEVWMPKTNTTMKVKSIGNVSAAVNHLRSSVTFTPSTIFPSADYTSTALPVSRASALSSTNYSLNGRRIPLTFWDKVSLAPAHALDAQPPCWIFVQRSGVSTNALTWNATLKDSSSTNTTYVLGRYAYQVYDVGGLLDINVAGGPTSLSAADRRALEGILASIDLTQFGNGFTSSNVNDLIAFRNAAISTSYRANLTSTLLATNGFMTTWSGNNRFLSRADLIRFATKEGFSGALEYLTHFSRDLNAPCWGPTYNAADYGGSASYAYRSSATTTTATNRFMPSFVTTTTTSQSYYNIQGSLMSTNLPAGTARMWKRFPLSRIDWLRQVENGSNPTLTSSVLLHFGLNWDGSTRKWIYNPDGGTAPVTPASQVLDLNSVPGTREPNFFELLKAGVLSGSLGAASGMANNLNITSYNYAVNNTTSASATLLQESNKDFHILKIGAAIIDQYDTDATPIAIDFDYASTMSSTWKSGYRAPATGIENIPYVYGLSQYLQVTGDSTTQTEKAWYQFELWNPHQSSASATPPSLVQFTSGNAVNSATHSGGVSYHTATSDTPIVISPGLRATGDRYIQMGTSAMTGFTTPRFFLESDSTASSEASGKVASTSRFGFYLGSASFSARVSNQYLLWYGGSQNSSLQVNGLPMQMQYQSTGSSGTAWVPYQFLNLTPRAGLYYNLTVSVSTTSSAVTYSSVTYSPSDPRTTRGGWKFSTTANTPTLYYGDGMYNSNPTVDSYSDTITRVDDGSNTNSATIYCTTSTERPIMLDRAFHTPADLGYAFRDERWKSLDFRTDKSADGGLLDLFSVYDDPVVVAGRVNLNSVRPEVVKAIVLGTTKNEATSTSFSSSDAGTVSSDYSTWIASNPMLSRAELVKFASTVSSSLFTANRKFEREGAIRALSGVGQTRTINLLIDLVSQSGFYGPASAKLDDFRVTGQFHYWVHLAIDRYSGRIVDMQLEPVYE